MSMSLRDQLLAAGLGNKNQAKQAREDQHRNRHTQQHQQRKGQKPGAGAGPGGRPLAPVRNVDPATLARDQALEQKKRDKAARKERAAQVRQLVEPNALPRLETDDYYNFVHDGRIARVGADAGRRRVNGVSAGGRRCLTSTIPAAGRFNGRQPAADWVGVCPGSGQGQAGRISPVRAAGVSGRQAVQRGSWRLGSPGRV